MSPGLDLAHVYIADLTHVYTAHHVITVGYDPDDLDRDLSYLSEVCIPVLLVVCM